MFLQFDFFEEKYCPTLLGWILLRKIRFKSAIRCVQTKEKMAWTIENGYFKPVPIRYKNHVWREVRRLLPPIHDMCMELDATLYLRGSTLEARDPHPLSDIDFVLVSKREHWMCLHQLIRNIMDIERRPVDLYLMQPCDIETDILMRLLLHTRSEYLVGPKRNIQPVKADFHTAKVHWDKFAVWKVPDALISNHEANACMVKQLLRSIGPIELVNHGRFSRHLPTCLKWVEERAPKNIISHFQQAWYNMGSLQNPPVVIQPARDWLIDQWNQIIINYGA